MTATDLTALLPLLLAGGTTVVVMLGIAVRRSHLATLLLTLAGLGAAFGCLWLAAPVAPRPVTPLLIVDAYALYFMGLILACAIGVALLAYDYLEKWSGHREEFYVLLLAATTGAMALAASSHFMSFFLSLELLSVPLYALIAYTFTRRETVEAGVKYLLLAAASAAFLLFGMALLYAETGAMRFDALGLELVLRGRNVNYWLLVPGWAFTITGIAFKLALAPFHMWTPDIYEGAPAPVTAFVATVSKSAMFALLLRYFYRTLGHSFEPIWVLFAILAIASMVAGNLLALLQTRVKRLLAYSSIAHLGYLLVAFEAGGEAGIGAVMFYMAAYAATSIAAFGVVTVLSGPDGEAAGIEDYRGLFWRRPALGGVLALALFSLAGIPFTAGFVGRFYVIAAGASGTLWPLLIVLAASSGIGLYYYLRLAVALFSRYEGEWPAVHWRGGLAVGAAAALVIWLGIYPEPLLDLIRASLGVF